MSKLSILTKSLRIFRTAFCSGKTIHYGCEKLIRPDLLHQVPLISEQLMIPKSQTQEVLSIYQKYLNCTPTANCIEFSAENIQKHVESFFYNENQMNCCLESYLVNRFKECFGLDILKSMVRNSINDISVESKAILNDLKYYGLDSKSAEIVQEFERNGIDLITSHKLKKHNILIKEQFLDKIIRNNLDKPRQINMFKNNIEKNYAAQYVDLNKSIEFNPTAYSLKDYVISMIDGKIVNELATIDYIIHEYFHLLHCKTNTFKQWNCKDTLFSHLCNKRIPDFGEKTREYFWDIEENCDAMLGIDFEFNRDGNMQDLDKAVKIIKEKAYEIFGEEAPKALQTIDESYQICQEVAKATREYATANVAEAVAVIGGEYKFHGTKLPKVCDDLLTELECPNFNFI